MSLLQKISLAFNHMTKFEQFLFTGCALGMVLNIIMVAVLTNVVGFNMDIFGLAAVNMVFLLLGAYGQYHSGKKRFLNERDSDEL